VATLPLLATVISRVEAGVPGLLPVVQTMVVAVAELTGQSIPSIVTLFSLAVDEKPVPVNVTDVPPATVPYFGDKDVRTGVRVDLKSTWAS